MPPRFVPTKLANWPWVVVRVDCVLCRRSGCYRLARLAAKYGPEQSIDGLLRDLAQDCPWYNERPRRYEPRCGVRFPDLERNFPPGDHPDEPIYRQRQPAREDVPKPTRETLKASAPGPGAPLLSDWTGDAVGFECPKCPRRGTFDKAALLLRHGDLTLLMLLPRLTADCPRRKETWNVYELCGARFVMPNDLGQRSR